MQRLWTPVPGHLSSDSALSSYGLFAPLTLWRLSVSLRPLVQTLGSCPASGAPWSSAMPPSLGRVRVINNNNNNNSSWLRSSRAVDLPAFYRILLYWHTHPGTPIRCNTPTAHFHRQYNTKVFFDCQDFGSNCGHPNRKENRHQLYCKVIVKTDIEYMS